MSVTHPQPTHTNPDQPSPTSRQHPPTPPAFGSTVLEVDDTPEATDPAIAQALREHQARMAVRPELPETMDAHEVARFLGVIEETVRKHARSGELLGYRVPGAGGHGMLRFKRADVLAYLEREPAAQAPMPCGCGGTLPDLDAMPFTEEERTAAQGER